MASLLTIIAALAPVVSQLDAILTSAVQATTTNDQETLDALHAQALALANSLRPAGQEPVA